MEYLHEKFGHYHHHHRVDEMACLDDEKMKRIQNDVPCHDHFEVVEFVLGQEAHDSINNVINAIVKMRICFHDVSLKTSKKHAIRKISGWSISSTLDSFDKKKARLYCSSATTQYNM
ncbi:hypothetical protein Tco_0805841 [Tanacetum coccineum]